MTIYYLQTALQFMNFFENELSINKPIPMCGQINCASVVIALHVIIRFKLKENLMLIC